jgi:hypothetical protein
MPLLTNYTEKFPGEDSPPLNTIRDSSTELTFSQNTSISMAT